MLSIKEHHEAIEYASKFRVSELRQKNPGLDKSFDKDWHNDIYVKCLVAALKYDPARGSMATYYGKVAKNAAHLVGRGIAKELKLQGYRTAIDHRIEETPVNDSNWDDDDFREVNCASDYELSNNFDVFATVQFELDLRKCVADMKPKMQDLFSEIIYEGSTVDVRRKLKVPKSTFHGQCVALRSHLKKWGFRSTYVTNFVHA
jgi:hypothetical protein